MFAVFNNATVVGYDVVDHHANQICCSGSMFVKPGMQKYSLADIVITGNTTSKITARKNFIQFMQSGDSPRLDGNRQFYYIATGTYAGWWKKSDLGQSSDTLVADPSTELFNVCEGFVCNFPTAAIKIQYSGEVVVGDSKSLTFNRPADYQIFVVANPSCGEINLNQITCAGNTTSKITARKNFIQFWQSGDSPRLDSNRQYYHIATGASAGWYLKSDLGQASDTKLTEDQAKAITIGVGEGFVCNFPTTAMSITLPTSL